jgi:hypothetical protein
MPLKPVLASSILSTSQARLAPVDAVTLGQASDILRDVQISGEQGLRAHALRLGDIAALSDPLVADKAELERAYRALCVARGAGQLTRDWQAKGAAGGAGAHGEPHPEFRARAEARAAADGGRRAGRQGRALFGGRGRGGLLCSRRALPPALVGAHDGAHRARGGRQDGRGGESQTHARHFGRRPRRGRWVATRRPNVQASNAGGATSADFLLKCGGAQAIGALAYGCVPGVPSADVIVGPGNRWVRGRADAPLAHARPHR